MDATALRHYGCRVTERIARIVQSRGDLLLAVGLTALVLLQIWLADESVGDRLVASAAGLGLGVLVALRIRLPLGLLVAFALSLPLGALLPKHLGDIESVGLVVVLAVYTAAAHTSGRRAAVGGVLTAAVGLVAMVTDPESVNVAAVVFYAFLFGAPWVAGRVVRRRRVNEARLEREKEAAETAIVEERARIARELHDVVAHAISVIVLQARGGRRLLDWEPDETRNALDAIESTGQQALVEMRRLLGLLRADDEELALGPQPSLTRLDSLVAEVEKAGLPVELTIEGDPTELPAGVDLSAYRIVQEALTNALKHAGPARARVLVRYGEEGLELRIADDGTGSGNGAGSGHGLVGIKERVAVLGGDLDAGPASSGGYEVRVLLPYASEK
jgi:signal transduction histidine kinase